MEDQMQLITLLRQKLRESVFFYAENVKTNYSGILYRNKDYGKYAIKRKITMLRQELLNLERMIDNG